MNLQSNSFKSIPVIRNALGSNPVEDEVVFLRANSYGSQYKSVTPFSSSKKSLTLQPNQIDNEKQYEKNFKIEKIKKTCNEVKKVETHSLLMQRQSDEVPENRSSRGMDSDKDELASDQDLDYSSDESYMEEKKHKDKEISVKPKGITSEPKDTKKSVKYSKRKYMLTRTDVLKKTILRALRKEYEYFFYQFLKQKNYSLEYDTNEFKNYLTEYAEYIKQFKDPVKTFQEFGTLENLPFVIGLFIDYCKIKRFSKTRVEKGLMKEFYEVLYKYSHTKFENFVKTPECRFLFSQVLLPEFLELFLNRHKTLRKSKERYRACAQDLIQQVNSYAQVYSYNQ